jgi:hypothetical protein
LKRILELTVAVPQPSGEIIVLRDQEWVWEITESIDTWCITDCKELVAKVLNLANQGFQFIVHQFVLHYNTAPIKAAVAKIADKYKTDKSTIRDALTLLEEAEKAQKHYGSYNLSPDEDTVEEGEFVQPPYISKNDFATARHVIGTLADWERFSKLMQLDYYGDPNYKTPSSFPAYEKEIWLLLNSGK